MFSRNESNCLREKLFKREVITSNFASGNQEVISIITQKLYERITKTTETCELKGLSAADLTIQKIYFRVRSTFDYSPDHFPRPFDALNHKSVRFLMSLHVKGWLPVK